MQFLRRQKSLPSASSDLSLPETQLGDWVDQIDIDGEKVTLRKKLPASYESVDSFSIDQPVTSSVFNQNTNSNTSQSTIQKQQEPNIDLELDVKVFINSGKCVLHTKDTIRDEEIKM